MGQIYHSKFDIDDIVQVHERSQKFIGTIEKIDFTDGRPTPRSNRQVIEKYLIKPDQNTTYITTSRWIEVQYLTRIGQHIDSDELISEDSTIPKVHEIEILQNLRSNVLDKWNKHSKEGDKAQMKKDEEAMNKYTEEIEKLQD